MGAPDARTAVDGQATGRHVIDVAEGRTHWAFQRPVMPAAPAVRRAD